MRYYERFFVEGQGEVTLANNSRQPLIVENISARGAGVVSNIPLLISDTVNVFINSTAKNPPFNRPAKVIWTKRLDDNLWESGIDFGEDHKINLS